MKKIDENEIAEIHSELPVGYQEYLNWLDEIETANQYKIISTSNCEIRAKEEWNTLGREIYDKDKTTKLARTVIDVTTQLGLSTFIFEHEYCRAKWFPEHFNIQGDKRKSFDFLSEIIGEQTVEDFNGVFEVSGYNEIEKVIGYFVDYPFLFRYRNLDLISKEVALVIKFSSHLSVDYVSQDQDLLKNITAVCKSAELRILEGS